MAGTDRSATADLKSQLVENAPSYSFFQAVRLLQGIMRREQAGPLPPSVVWDKIRIRPNLSLSFPETDLDKIEEAPDGHGFRVTANFLGLYGVSSPLPTYYTEDLLEERRNDKRAVRAFLDIFHYAVYSIFFESWAKNRQFLAVFEEGDTVHLDRLYALIGLGEQRTRDRLPHAYHLLRYAGLFTQFPRSALGLQTLLGDALDGLPVEVVSCLRQRMDIPADQRLKLGTDEDGLGQGRLGEGAWLGQSMPDRMNHFLIRIGPLSADAYHQLLPGQPQYGWLRFLARFYQVGCLGSTLDLTLEAGSAQTACLGVVQWGRLGLDTWIYAGDYQQEVHAAFVLYK